MTKQLVLYFLMILMFTVSGVAQTKRKSGTNNTQTPAEYYLVFSIKDVGWFQLNDTKGYLQDWKQIQITAFRKLGLTANVGVTSGSRPSKSGKVLETVQKLTLGKERPMENNWDYGEVYVGAYRSEQDAIDNIETRVYKQLQSIANKHGFEELCKNLETPQRGLWEVCNFTIALIKVGGGKTAKRNE